VCKTIEFCAARFVKLTCFTVPDWRTPRAKVRGFCVLAVDRPSRGAKRLTNCSKFATGILRNTLRPLEFLGRRAVRAGSQGEWFGRKLTANSRQLFIQFPKSGCIRRIWISVRMNISDWVADFKHYFRPVQVCGDVLWLRVFRNDI
jgi:hypothetical protein